jgi:alkanesulfonate monooxygenase SsuD/methylene tetrahydromethanopterin reductase-like flavin-dependent oxidoreductase (luciferase family)
MEFGVHLPQIGWQDPESAGFDRELHERLSQMLRRPIEDLVGRLPVGTPVACLDLMGRFRDAGMQRILVWPMRDDAEQLERVAAEIIPHL